MGFDIKCKFLSLFREFLVYHHRSLEFRAKVFAAIISAKLNPEEDDFENLYDISSEIYGGDENRKRQAIRANKNYALKIDFEHLRRLIDADEYEGLVQQRVYDFLLYEVKTYAPNR